MQRLTGRGMPGMHVKKKKKKKDGTGVNGARVNCVSYIKDPQPLHSNT